ncbi:MAG: Rieske (2Fe-2S) protein [Verrucomicrobiota bacterium]
MSWLKTIDFLEVSESEPELLMIGGKEIGLVRDGEKIYAMQNVCPHMRAQICFGDVEKKLIPQSGDGKRLTYDSTEKVIRCPWHHWEFSLETGKSPCAIPHRLNVFPAEVRDGVVWIDVPESLKTKGWSRQQALVSK